VGSDTFSTEAWIGNTGLNFLVIDGLLPTGSFSQLYIDNRDCFVIFEPSHKRHRAGQSPEEVARSAQNP